jgi:hypothetical protein
MSLTDTQIKLYNDEFLDNVTKTESVKFHQFPLFPIEIRLQVWNHCFPRNRQITVCIALAEHKHQGMIDLLGATKVDSEPYTITNHLGNIISSYDYRVHTLPFRQWSRSLLYVNKESCQAFRSFYRTSIVMQHGAPSLLHLQPDMDTLEVYAGDGTSIDAVIAFLHDCVASDSQGVGVSNLILGKNARDLDNLANLDSSQLHPSARQAITKLLTTNLKNFYACATIYQYARNMCQIVGGPFHRNRSFPIMAKAKMTQFPNFQLLDHDPRPIDTDLKFVYADMTLRRNMYNWHKFMAEFCGQSRPVPIKTHYLLYLWPDSGCEDDGNRAAYVEYIRAQNTYWKHYMRHMNAPIRGDKIDEEEYQKLETELLDVVGAWVLDGDALGEMSDIEHDLTRE